MLPRLLDSLGPVDCLANNLDICLGMEYLTDVSTHTFVVIHHQHAKGGRSIVSPDETRQAVLFIGGVLSRIFLVRERRYRAKLV